MPFLCVTQEYHPLFMGKEFIGPAIEHFQEITAQFPEVRTNHWVFPRFRGVVGCAT